MGSINEAQPSRRNARDDVEFLVGSWNRLEVLDAIASAPRTRDELGKRVDVSRVTLSRILSDLESKGWISRKNGDYEITRAGAFVAAEVTGMVANIQTLNHLGENVSWIRLDQFDFDLAHLQEAEVIMPTWDNFSAQTSTLVDLVYECTNIRGIGTGLDREFMKAVGDATINGELSVELIFEPAVVDAIIGEPELARLFRDLSDSNHAAIYRYQGEKALMELGINEREGGNENVVMLCGEHDEGAPPGTIETTNETVWDWAEAYFESRRAESHQLRATVFTP